MGLSTAVSATWLALACCPWARSRMTSQGFNPESLENLDSLRHPLREHVKGPLTTTSVQFMRSGMFLCRDGAPSCVSVGARPSRENTIISFVYNMYMPLSQNKLPLSTRYPTGHNSFPSRSNFDVTTTSHSSDCVRERIVRNAVTSYTLIKILTAGFKVR